MQLRISHFRRQDRDVLVRVQDDKDTVDSLLTSLGYDPAVYTFYSASGFSFAASAAALCSDVFVEKEHLSIRPISFDAYWDSLSEEHRVRSELACCYRLFHEFGWTDTIYGHLTARLPGHTDRFLINPFGAHYREIAASDLVVIDTAGQILSAARPSDIVNRAGFVIHGAIHTGRPDIHCVMHCHTKDGVAISTLAEAGLLTGLCQTGQILGPVAYHDYEGIAVDQAEQERLQRDLGTQAKVLILRNHGLVSCGGCVGEALLMMHLLNEACSIQCRALAMGKPIRMPAEEVAQKTFNIAAGFNGSGNVGKREMRAFAREMFARDPSFVW